MVNKKYLSLFATTIFFFACKPTVESNDIKKNNASTRSSTSSLTATTGTGSDASHQVLGMHADEHLHLFQNTDSLTIPSLAFLGIDQDKADVGVVYKYVLKDQLENFHALPSYNQGIVDRAQMLLDGYLSTVIDNDRDSTMQFHIERKKEDFPLTLEWHGNHHRPILAGFHFYKMDEVIIGESKTRGNYFDQAIINMGDPKSYVAWPRQRGYDDNPRFMENGTELVLIMVLYFHYFNDSPAVNDWETKIVYFNLEASKREPEKYTYLVSR
ncbi:hypothetical protein PVA45_06085 [Entomospira entomophila]|uniref:Lipoprotein n=1 Tax=Entomospira entomophila TaxID=2719988 RepID=A0A968KRS9_9SPIO|nr:hypothetical protein [Entomospira entomophilus]NIZ41068.1 hypothetical protein [Entomospira entomophilus]WDI35277.1 hypothetical protein PVA45_06085 [Entomospira entomophilus]